MQSISKSWGHDLAARNRAPRTIKDYQGSLERFTLWCDSQGLDLLGVTRHHIRAWIGHELGQISAKTTNRHYQAIRQFYQWALAEEEVSVDPTKGVPQPRVPESVRPIPPEADIKKLLGDTGADFCGVRDRAILMVLLDCGLRSTEMMSLTLADLDLDEGTILVRVDKSRRGRVVPIGRKAMAAVDKYLRLRAKRPEADQDWLWLGRKGKLSPSGLQQLLERHSKRAGVAHVHPHQLRRAFAHIWLASGGGETDLMAITGWKSRSMINHYTGSLASARAKSAHRKISPGDRL